MQHKLKRPANSTDQSAFGAARDICRKQARSFYFASFFLPKPKRDAAYAVYAFCRMIDDAIDLPESGIHTGGDACGSDLQARLELFGSRLDAIYAGELDPPTPAGDAQQLALHAFAQTVHRYEIPQEYFVDLAEGRRMDLTTRRYATWAALERYCYHAAGVLGLVMCGVFGLTNSGARQSVIEMGNAMQLTKILSDVKQDWERGRVYLPLEDMVRFGYSERNLAGGVANENFRELMRFEIERARQLYRRGAEGLCWLAGDGSRLTASAIVASHSGILGQIERQDYDVFRRRACLTKLQKLGRLPLAWRLARRQADEPLPSVFGRSPVTASSSR